MPKLLVSRDDRTDVEISYEDQGAGRPVVLVHGWPLSGRSWEAQVPTLVLHGDSDAVVPFEASGRRTAEMVPGAELVVIAGGPHGVNVSHAAQFNAALLDFLGGQTAAARAG